MTCERHTAGAIETSRLCRVMTMPAEKASAITSAAPSPSALPLPGAPTITPTPTAATIIDSQARRVTPRRSQTTRSAGPTGATACMKKTLATVAWFSATRNAPDATAVQTATQTPRAASRPDS